MIVEATINIVRQDFITKKTLLKMCNTRLVKCSMGQRI